MVSPMKLISPILVFVAISLLSLGLVLQHAASAPNKTSSDQPTRPVIVELFTSEGCSSCPPADALLAKLDAQQRLGNAEIIALEEHVDYWNQLGWKDPFSSSEWTQRQQDYSGTFGNAGVYTPQMVVDGRTEFVGSSERKARAAIADAAQQPKAEVQIEPRETGASEFRVKISAKMLPGADASHNAEVWLAVTETGLHSNVSRGENAGEDLHHAAVVRSLRKAGSTAANEEPSFSGEQNVRLDPGWKRENLRFVVFVQEHKTRHILGAASVKIAQ